MKVTFSIFSAKILLFGEYTLMLGSKALTIPFTRISGRFDFDLTNSALNRASTKSLRDFFEYLNKHKTDFPEGLDINLDLFKTDLEKGLYLNSDIPQGYGVGSSGVVVASVYAEYAKNPVIPKKGSDLIALKNYFSFMESCFHGKSSGLDPLICYAGIPLLVSSPEKIEMVEFPCSINDRKLDIFLLDTKMTSKTEGMVQLFLEKSKNKQYIKVLENSIIPRNNHCIDSILKGNILDFFCEVRVLSDMQLEYFAEMIPKQFQKLWEIGITTGDYSLKLCGSGGGGFILGFTEDYNKVEKYFPEKDKKILITGNNSESN